MGYKLTLIEYDEDVYDGEDASPDIEYRDYQEGNLGGDSAATVGEQTEADRIDIKIDKQLSDLHDYLIGISSSSSSSSSFSSESSSSESSSSSSKSSSSSSQSSSSESSSSESSSSESSSSSSSSSCSPIDIGPGAVDRSGAVTFGYTIICLGNPANETGVLTSAEIFAHTNITGMRIGTFYNSGGNTFVCRDSDDIGNVTQGSKQTFEVNINVEAGDYLGAYWASGTMKEDTSGEDGYYYASGEHIDPEDSENYALSSGRAISIYAES